MADLTKEVPLVKLLTIREKDLEQISRCPGLRITVNGEIFQREANASRRELRVIGWFSSHGGDRCLLVRRVDDGRLMQRQLLHGEGELVASRYLQLFVR